MSVIISISIDKKSARYLAKLRERDTNISSYINRLIHEDIRKNGL